MSTDRKTHDENRRLAFVVPFGLISIAIFLTEILIAGVSTVSATNMFDFLMGIIGAALFAGLVGGFVCLVLFDVSCLLLPLCKKMNKRRSAAMVSIVTVVFAVVLGFVWGVGKKNCISIGLISYCLPTEFDSRVWKQDKSLRLKMINSLLKTENLEGLSEKQIVQLLGKADERYEYMGEVVLHYDLKSGGHLHHYVANLSIYLKHDVVFKHNYYSDT